MKDIEQLFSEIKSNNKDEAKSIFDGIIADKVTKALDARKAAIAQQRFNESKQVVEKNMYDAPDQYKKGDKVYIHDGENAVDFEGVIIGFVGRDKIKIKGEGDDKGKTETIHGKWVTLQSDMDESTDLKEGSMDKMSLQDLWMDFADADFVFDQGYGIGKGSPRWNGKKQDAIYNYVSKKFGKKVADDMADYGSTRTYADEYAGPDEAPEAEKHMKKLAKKHGIKEK